MKKHYSLLFLLFTAFGVFVLQQCIYKQDPLPRKTNPEDEVTDPNSLRTLPGNNFFLTTAGGVRFYFLYPVTTLSPVGQVVYVNAKDSTELFGSVSGKCDTVATGFSISMVTGSGSKRYSVNTYFQGVPASDGMLKVVPYKQQPLTDTTTWVVATEIPSGKTWNAVSGKLTLSMNNGRTIVRFDTLKIEYIPNFTDTTYTKMSGTLVCE